MSVTSSPAVHRRAGGPPGPLAREIPRVGLIERLRGRFGRPVTVLVAGAGFGKTTALAQAVRDNLIAPSGIDVWVGCEATDEDEQRLATAVATALATHGVGGGAGGGDALGQVIEAIVGLAPVDVCLTLDDLHLLPTGSGGHRLIGDLVAILPANGHLVLSSRQPPPVPLARLRAATTVDDIGEAELGFSSAEASSLAGLYRPVDDRRELGGWPALVALSLSTDRAVATDYLWEEVVTGLGAETTQALLAMATLGDGTLDEAASVLGRPDRVVAITALRRALAVIPLLSSDPDQGTFRVHDLWVERVDQLFAAAEVDALRSRVRALLSERGQALRLGTLALRWGDDTTLATAAQALVALSLVDLPVETGRRWLTISPPSVANEPAFRLLALAVQVAEDPTDPTIDERADQVVAAFLERADVDGIISATVLAITAAYQRGDLVRAFTLVQQVRSSLPADDSPTLALALAGADATLAYLGQGAEVALEILEPCPTAGVPTSFVDFVAMLKANWLLDVGRADEAVAIIDDFERPDPSSAEFASYLRWHAGRSAEFADGPPDLGDLESLDARRRFIRCAEVTDIASSLGQPDRVGEARDELTDQVGAVGGALFSASAAGVLAKAFLAEHDPVRARSIIEAHLAAFPVDHPVGEAQLRRCLAPCYLASDTLARRWDTVSLGPLHRRVHGIVQMLIAARSDRLEPGTELDDAGLIIASLPLPCSVELMVAAQRDQVVGASDLIDALVATALAPLRSELRVLATDGDPSRAEAAADLLSQLPHPDGPVLRIGILGPMTVHLAGKELEPAELRRARVRTVLTLLAVRGPLRREELMELVWPERDPDRARQNLRTTLTYLRRLLEPHDGSDHPRRLRTEGDRIALAERAAIEVDLWEFRRLVDASARSAAGSSDPITIDRLQRAVDLWRGDPVPDLDSVIGLEPEIETIRAELVDAGYRLGELLLISGRFDQALACADRAQRTEPYSERAHRLAISALLQLGDRHRLKARVEVLRQMLDELGVEPETSTGFLLTRASGLLGTLGA